MFSEKEPEELSVAANLYSKQRFFFQNPAEEKKKYSL